MTIRERIQQEIDTLTLQSQKMDEAYKASKISTETRIVALKRLLPLVTDDLERLVQALGIQIQAT